MTRKSVLAHLVPRLTLQTENAATDVLAFLINSSELVRRAVADMLRHLTGAPVVVAHAHVQIAEDRDARPDLKLLDAEGNTTAYVEAKFWAGLTDAQPNGYLKLLEECGGRCLVFVAPDRRLVPLWHEVIGRCGVQVTPGGPLTCRVGRCTVSAVGWHHLLGALVQAAGPEPETLADLRQLQSLVEALDEEAFLPLKSEELDDLETPRRLLCYAKLADEIVDAAVASGVLGKKGKAVGGVDYYGRGALLGEEPGKPRAAVWIGVNHSLWARNGRGPLWLETNDRYYRQGKEARLALQPWRLETPPRLYAEEEWRAAIPLVLATNVERDAVIVDVVRQLRVIAAALRDAGVPVLGAVQESEEEPALP